jgi:predicted ATPase
MPKRSESGEPPEDPLLAFSILYSFWVANSVFDSRIARDLACEFLVRAEKQGMAAPLMIGHRLMAHSLLHTGKIVECRLHYNQALALYDPLKHRTLALRFGQDAGVSIFSNRSLALWLLGYPEAALVDVQNALDNAREIGHAATLMYALLYASFSHACCANYTTANALADELVTLADQKDAQTWKGLGAAIQGSIFAQAGKRSEAVDLITCGITACRAAGATIYGGWFLSNLAMAYADLDKFDEACRCISEATTETTRETWCEAEVNRIAGEIALKSSQPDSAKAQAYFQRALTVAREQQAKSWELRAAMSMARLWRDQGKRDEARELLAPVYGWFTEGFDTRDLKEAKALLDELAA